MRERRDEVVWRPTESHIAYINGLVPHASHELGGATRQIGVNQKSHAPASHR